MTKDIKIVNEEYSIDSRYKSADERKLESNVLMEARLQRMENANPSLIIRAKLLQLKLKMDEFLKKPVHEVGNYFTDFLSIYIDIIYNKRNDFALDINISKVKLSQVLNNHREPQKEFILRLMLHSELIYKNVCEFNKQTWYEVYYFEKICDIMSRQEEWRPEVEKHVKTSIYISG